VRSICAVSALFQGLIKMANLVITLNVMPSGIDINLDKLEESVKEEITKAGGEVGKVEREPIGFGLELVKIFFIWDEDKGGTDNLESKIRGMSDVSSAEISDVRRGIG